MPSSIMASYQHFSEVGSAKSGNILPPIAAFAAT
jgi:hypothetical protein